MANPSPHRGRLGKKLRGKPGDMPQLLLILWHALKRSQGVLDRVVEDDEATLKACHAISQIAGQYAKLLEIGELEARIAALEQSQQGHTL